MHWFDYSRGYDDGRYDGRKSSRGRGGWSLLLFVFAVLKLLLRLIFFILRALAGLLWLATKLIFGKFR